MKKARFQKLTKQLISLLAVLAVCMSMGFSSVFADQGKNADNAIVKSEKDETNIQAAITKQFETGQTTTFDDATFTFNFVQDTTTKVDAKGNAIDIQTDAATIKDVTAVVKSSMTGSPDPNNALNKIIQVQTSDFIAGATFPHAGVYAFDVTEAQKGFTTNGNPGSSIVYSQASYKLYVYVANKSDGSGTYVYAVGDLFAKDDAGLVKGQTGADEKVGSKVDPTPNPTPDTENGVPSDTNSKMIFKNSYVESKTPDPENPNPEDPTTYGLKIDKTVAGTQGDQTKDFNYTLNVTKPTLTAATASSFTVVKIDAAGKKTPETVDYSADYTFTLKHNEKLILSDVYVGSTYTLTETGTPNYTASVAVTSNGNSTLTKAAPKVGDGIDTLLDATKLPAGTTNTHQVIGANANEAAFTNTYKDVTPTGILMNNLPFITLIVVAGGLMVGYAVMKSKRRAA